MKRFRLIVFYILISLPVFAQKVHPVVSKEKYKLHYQIWVNGQYTTPLLTDGTIGLQKHNSSNSLRSYAYTKNIYNFDVGLDLSHSAEKLVYNSLHIGYKNVDYNITQNGSATSSYPTLRAHSDWLTFEYSFVATYFGVGVQLDIFLHQKITNETPDYFLHFIGRNAYSPVVPNFFLHMGYEIASFKVWLRFDLPIIDHIDVRKLVLTSGYKSNALNQMVPRISVGLSFRLFSTGGRYDAVEML